MSKTLRVEIITPEGKLFAGQVRMVIARATTGEIGVLPGHAPLITLLDSRPVRLLTGEGEQQLMVQGGVMQVNPELVTIITGS
ncbi:MULTISPECIES: ATP synthase F1 subunit epsilon [Sporomusa]|uniref:ATP synthase F1 subunit epsilon n=1 Tax=Sporomusa TaxID=2375 RepID=UPI001666F516|nr:ATP synthase F1 subunit epsilon [Sporomusa sp. GT1]MCM0759030.1 ATP synthase F1 subunit epsilon [Sporomusa sphaeroides DSM 2875]